MTSDVTSMLDHAVQAGGDLAIRLPGTLTARAFGPAWVLALTAHAMVAALALLAPVHSAPEEPLVRLVYLEPPPPPPALLGASSGSGVVVAQPQPQPAEIVPERPKVQPKPAPVDPTRLHRADAKAKKPKVAPKPQPRVEPQEAVAAPVAPAPGVESGSVHGQAGGVVGGIEGGLQGGVVGGTGTNPIPVGQVAQRPQLIHRVQPLYPESARRRDVQGLVLLEAVLDRDGRVEPAVKVLRSIPMLDAEAVAAVRQWRFQPARNNGGDPVRVVLEIPIRFTLR